MDAELKCDEGAASAGTIVCPDESQTRSFAVGLFDSAIDRRLDASSESRHSPLRNKGFFVRRSVVGVPWRRAATSLAAAVSVLGLNACALRNIGPELRQGSTEPETFPTALLIVQPEYRIGPSDKLDVKVFREPDLTVLGAPVDADGQVRLPLIGSITAAGKSASQLSRELEALYRPKYLADPEITVTVASAVSQKVTIQGEVKSAGVYPLAGPTTLLDTLSLAGGESEVAALNQVVVLRTVSGQRMGAIFDAAAIRRGDAPDPAILGNDVVIVGISNARKLYRDILQATPLLLNIFRPF